MSIFSPRKKNTVSSTQQRQPQPQLTLSRSHGSIGPVTTINEFGQYPDQRPPRTLLPPPSTANQRLRTAAETSAGSAYNRELPDAPAPRFLDARFPTENDAHDVLTQEVGYMCEGRQVTLGLQTVTTLLQVVGKELEAKALTTPLVFSTRALDLSSHRVRSLVRAFLRTVGRPSSDPEAERRWRDEVRFAGPHELAAMLRWGLSRVVRVLDGIHLRGFVDIAAYDDWRQEELNRRYSPDAFLAFPPKLAPEVQPLLSVLFPLLSRFAANANYSGLNPVALANLFGPLIFGLGLPSQPFTATYNAYLVASHATEHLLLAFIRLQDFELHSKSGVSIPTRLKDWIRGYPAMLPGSRSALDQPRKGAKTVRVISVRRNVRLYSPNLIQTASTWPAETTQDQPIREWNRIAGPGKTAQPLYSDGYRKRLDLQLTAQPTSPYLRLPPTPPPKNRESPTVLGTIVIPEVDKFKSLTDLRWGMFENTGFDPPDVKMLEFDLTESARKRQPSKRDTVAWSDFANVGFTPDELTLDFAPPLQDSINTWPDHQAELHRKLRKQQKALPSFGWDTHPVHGRDKLVEEGFIDCWADLLLSTGWMDREELTFRDCNWVLVEYKAAPEATSNDSRPASTLSVFGTDNRVSGQWYVFEEFVPREYREAIVNPKKKRGGLFSVKNKKLLPVITNGRATPSGGPRSPAREAEFERLIAGSRDDNTRKITLSPPPPPEKSKSVSRPHAPAGQTESRLRKPPFPLHPTGSSGPLNRLKNLGRHSPSPAEETAVDVEFAAASLSDGSDPEIDARGGVQRQAKNKEQWIDVRFADRNKRQPELPASPVSQHRPATPPRPQSPPVEEEDETMEPVQRETLPTPTPEGQSPISEYPPEEYESDSATPVNLRMGREFPVPPDRSANRRGIVFPSTGDSPSASEAGEDQDDFEPYQQVAEDEVGHSHAGEEVEDEGDAASAMSGPDNATPFDPNSPGGIPVEQWHSTRNAEQAAKHGSGVSSLIALYQERDRVVSHDPGPSRIPIRTTSPPNLPLGAPVRTTSPLTASPKPAQSSEGSVLFEPDKVQATFPRYVHGAPLHNLIEAPEEEETVVEE